MRTCLQKNSQMAYFLSYPLVVASTLSSIAFSVYIELNPAGQNYPRPQAYHWFFYATHLGLLSNLAQQAAEARLAWKAWPIQENREGYILRNASTYEPWRTANITLTLMITGLFWGLSYEKSQYGAILPNALVHGLPLLTYAALVVVNNLSYATHAVKSYVVAAIPAFLYIVANAAYVKAGGKNELGQDYIYPSLSWNEHPYRALIISAIGLAAIFPAQVVLNRSLNFLRSFPYPAVLTSAQAELLGTPRSRAALPQDVSWWSRQVARFQNRNSDNTLMAAPNSSR